MAISRRHQNHAEPIPPPAPSVAGAEAAPNLGSDEPNLVNEDPPAPVGGAVLTPDGVVEPDRLADPDSETAQVVNVKPIVGVRLDHYTPEDAVEVDAHERRVYDYNQLAKAEGRPQAVTREEMDRIP